MSNERESVKVLQECIELQRKKSQDYQHPNSNVVQAMHYRRGVDSIHDIMHGKMLRAQSLLESKSEIPNFESLEDTYKDLINYASFAVAYLRGKMDGQNPNCNIKNEPIVYITGQPLEPKLSSHNPRGSGSASGSFFTYSSENKTNDSLGALVQHNNLTAAAPTVPTGKFASMNIRQRYEP